MLYKTLALTLMDDIAHVELNRPEKLNAMTGLMFEELGHVFDHLSDTPSVRAAVLSGGDSKHFTAGLDLQQAGATLMQRSGDPARERDQLRRLIKNWQQGLDGADRARIPVIAAIHKGCIGGGVDLVCACDIRLATKDSWFAIKEIDVGIVADIGTLQRIGHLLPNGIVRELAYTGRDFPAAEALERGFVNHLYDDKDALLQAAFAMARDLAKKSPMAMMGTKAILNHARDHTLADGLDYVATWNSGMLLGEDVQKAAMAMMSKGEVQFDDLMAYHGDMKADDSE